MVAVRSAEALRDEGFHQLPVELVAPIAERHLGLRVRTDDPPGRIDGQDRVRRELEETVEDGVALAQRRVRALEVGIGRQRETARHERDGHEGGGHGEQRSRRLHETGDAVCRLPDRPELEQVREAARDEERGEVPSLTAKRQIGTLPGDIQDDERDPAVRERDPGVGQAVQPDELGTPIPQLAERW